MFLGFSAATYIKQGYNELLFESCFQLFWTFAQLSENILLPSLVSVFSLINQFIVEIMLPWLQ